MTRLVSPPPRSGPTRRRELLSRTALCGALAGIGAFLAGPAEAAPILGSTEFSAGGAAPGVVTAGAATNVVLHAPRTIINWNSFNVADNESVNFGFDSRNWIVLNNVGSFEGPTIDGSITGKVGNAFGGNVWFVSRGGVIFGPNARVETGGLLVTTAPIDKTSFLNPGNLQFQFADGEYYGANAITLQKGAKFTTHGGLLALVASSVISDVETSVSAQDGGSVLYGGAATYTLRLAQTASNDFDLVDFIVPNSSVGSTKEVPIDLQGATSGNSVFVAVVSHTSFATAVIDLEGMVTANSASTDGGDIVLSGGGGIVGRLPGPTVPGGAPTDLYLNVASASRDVQIRNAGRTFGKPWLRPSKQPVTQNPPDCEMQAGGCNGYGGSSGGGGNSNGNSNGNSGSGNGSYNQLLTLDDKTPFLQSGVDLPVLLSDADASLVSNVGAGRDFKLVATANIELGVVRSGRDLSLQGAAIKANSLGAAGALTVTATAGDVKIAAAGAGGNTAITATGDITLDSLGLTGPANQKAAVSGQNVIFGGGVFGGAGSLDVNGTGDVTVDAGQARLGAVTAGGTAFLRGGGLDIGSVKAKLVAARATSVKIGSATSAGDLYIFSTNGDAILGQASAGDDIYVNATNGTASLTGAAIAGLGPDNVGASFAGNTDLFDNGRVVEVTSNQDAKLGLGTGAVTGATRVTLNAAQDAIVDVTGVPASVFSMFAGRDATLKAPSVSFNQVVAGRDLSLITSVGDFTVSNALVATRNITLGAAGALKTADVRADSGSITLSGKTVAAGALTAGQDLILKATGGAVQIASFKTGRDLILQGSSFSLGSVIGPVGRDLSITALGDFGITQDLSAARNITFDIQGKATVGNLSAASVQVLAGDLDLTGTVTAPTIQIESRTGAFRLGGSAADGALTSGLWLDNAEFGRLRVSTSVKLYAGPVAGTVRGDLTALNLSVNPTLTPNVALYAAGAQNILVQGIVAPTASGGVLRIGDVGTGVWRPSSILVTGSLGSAAVAGGNYADVRAFGDLRLHAQNDILMGSQRFITLIQQTAVADIDVGAGKPTGSAATASELNHVFATAGRLEVSSDGKVVAQNTGPTLGAPVGVLITSKGSPDLIIDPPKIVQLFGSLIDSTGKLISSFGAGPALTVAVVDASGNPTSTPQGASYTFNTCAFGTTQCSGAALALAVVASGGASGSGGSTAESAASATLSLSQTAPIGKTSDGDDGKTDSESAAALATPPPPLLAVAPVDLKEIVTDPVTTGTGSEEIWRKNRAKSK